jgi:hypothetical protein
MPFRQTKVAKNVPVSLTMFFCSYVTSEELPKQIFMKFDILEFYKNVYIPRLLTLDSSNGYFL